MPRYDTMRTEGRPSGVADASATISGSSGGFSCASPYHVSKSAIGSVKRDLHVSSLAELPWREPPKHWSSDPGREKRIRYGIHASVVVRRTLDRPVDSKPRPYARSP